MTMKRAVMRAVVFGLVAMVSVWAKAELNLCFNADFTNTNSAFEGWNINYQWEENSWYMNNHQTVSILPEHKGRRHVLCINPGEQSKVECKLIKIEPGFRYRCTLDTLGGGSSPNGTSRFYITGYEFAPGVAPYDEPELKDMRRVLKADPWVGAHVNPWRTVTFEYPHKQVSELEAKHLKKVRYITIYLLANRGEPTYVSNIKVVKLPETYTVLKSTSTESRNPASKLGSGTAASRLGKKTSGNR